MSKVSSRNPDQPRLIDHDARLRNPFEGNGLLGEGPANGNRCRLEACELMAAPINDEYGAGTATAATIFASLRV